MRIVRSFCLLAALLVCAARVNAADPGTGESFQGPVGLQLWSLRGLFLSDGEPATLDKVKGYGIKTVELAGTGKLTPEKFLAQLEERGIKAISAHLPYDLFKKDPAGAAKQAKALGLKYVGTAWISHKAPFDEAQCRDAAAVFNKAGEECAKEGIRFFYHVHGYEFQKHGEGTLFDLLMAETKKELVGYEMDVMWVVFPGQDPVKLLEKYGDRWELMHVKDLKKGVATGALTGKTDKENDVILGTGQMDWPAILKAAKKAGVKHYFIEDEHPDAAQHIPESMKYLEGVKF